ncbi:hypothetical protein ACWGIU_11425 [Streptomyces sp. NPDC054840]
MRVRSDRVAVITSGCEQLLLRVTGECDLLVLICPAQGRPAPAKPA